VSKSLQDQLLALGLAKEKAKQKSGPPYRPPRPPNKAGNPGKPAGSQAPHGPGRDSRASKGGRATGTAAAQAEQDISLEQAYRIRESQEKSEKQRERERKLEEDRQRAALNRQIKQIVEAGRLNLPDASEARYFMYKDRIRKIHVSAEQLQELNSGLLGVVYLAGGYHLLKAGQVEAVKALSPAHVPDLLAGGSDDDELWAAEEEAAAESGAEPGAEPGAGPEMDPEPEPEEDPATKQAG